MMKRAGIVWMSLVAITVLGCGGGSTAQRGPAGPGDKAAGKESPAKNTSDTAGQKSDKDELLKKTLERLGDIEAELAKLRSLSFDKPVPAERQSPEDFRKYLESEIERDMPKEENANQSLAVYHLGLVKKKIDLAASMKEALASQVGAYYDPRQGKFFVVLLADDAKQMDTIAAHELTHALQDQHFDLMAYYGEEPKKDLNQDELQARRFVVEGEATLTMFAYLVKSMSGHNPLEDEGGGLLATQLETLASTSVDDQVRMAKLQAKAFVGMDEETRKALEALDDIPRYILVPLMESYTKGALPVMRVYLAGGWDAVNKLYSNPPASTEQVLHPQEKLVEERDEPVVLSLKPIKGWDKVYSDVMGELLWRVYFENWTPKGKTPKWAAKAAAGWDGDRFLVSRHGDDVGAILATTWDDEAEASEFKKAYEESLAQRFSGIKLRPAKPISKKTGKVTTATRPDGAGEIAVVQRKTDVFIVDGAPSALLARRWLHSAMRSTDKQPFEGLRN